MMSKICILVRLLLLLPPVWGNDSYLRSEYIHYRDTMTWRDAQAFCRRNHTDLVTIRDTTENRSIFRGWIGLYRNASSSEWKWSRGDQIANFTRWAHGYPHHRDNCAWKHRPWVWYSHECSNHHSRTCYDEKLFLVKEKKTWEKALEHCRALEAVDPSKPATANRNYRYDLATLLSEDDYAFAQEKAQEATTEEVWTGLRYLAGQWFWVGGETAQRNISSCPRQFCGALVKNDTFSVRNCWRKKNFLCYKKP